MLPRGFPEPNNQRRRQGLWRRVRTLTPCAMPKRAKPTTPMAPGGGSEQWESSLANQRRIGDMCLEWLPDKDLAAEAGAKSGHRRTS